MFSQIVPFKNTTCAGTLVDEIVCNVIGRYRELDSLREKCINYQTIQSSGALINMNGEVYF